MPPQGVTQAPQGATPRPARPQPGEGVRAGLNAVIAGEVEQKVVLHLFSGPQGRADGMAAFLYQQGWHCIDVDTVNDKDDDLANDAMWELIFAAVISGNVHFVWMGPPCTTFSPARRHDPGPKPVRDANHHRGFPKTWLSPAQVEEVRTANYFVVQCARLGELALAKEVSFAIENPQPWQSTECASMFDFEEMTALTRRPGVETTDFHQCMLGALTRKPTRVVHAGIDLSDLAGTCNHPEKHWKCEYRDNNGKHVVEWQWASHPKLVCTRKADGSWASKAAAAYPAAMNAAIARAVGAQLGGGPGPSGTATRWQ